ncbi:MAG: hypothetical protein QW717_06525 [Candidatus Bathyarchaeia archaeon]
MPIKPMETELIGVQAPQAMTELAFYSRYVKGERFVNLLLVAEPETAKTELPAKYVGNFGIISIRRFSHVGVLNMLEDEIIKTNKPVTFVIPDLDAIYKQKQDVVERTIQFLDAITWDGLNPEATYLFDYKDLEKFRGFKAQIIAGITTFGFFTKSGSIRANLLKGGYITRFIPFCMDYSASQVSRILDEIFDGSHRKKYIKRIPLKFPPEKIEVYLTKPQAEKLKDLTKDLAQKLGSRGFRLGQQLISLAKASVIRDRCLGSNRPKWVTEEDVDLIKFLSEWIGFEQKPLRDYVGWTKT